MADINSIDKLNEVKGFKIVHLNIRSIVKKIDQLRVLLQDTSIEVFTLSETWLKPFLHTALFEIEGYKLFRLDRKIRGRSKKRGGGLLMYVRDSLSSSCEYLDELNASNSNIEAQWLLIHRPHCKNVVIGNLYRPPGGNLEKAVTYLDNSLRTINLAKIDLFLVGDLNVDLMDKTSNTFKKLQFFIQSNGLTQYIRTATRNTAKSSSLIDVAISNSKYISQAGTLEHHISDHQPIFIVHKKGRDKRDTVNFDGRSYRNFDRAKFRDELRQCSWEEYFNIRDPTLAWDFIHKRVTSVLDVMCPIRSFRIKNYRPDWMTNELIEQLKDRDYFYKKAKLSGDADAWNIAKFLRNTTNSHIRNAKREFILNELRENEDNAKKFWKVIRKVIPSSKSSPGQSILLKDKGEKVEKDQVASYINDFFINVGKVKTKPVNVPGISTGGVALKPELTGWEFEQLTETRVYNVIKDINVAKSSGIDNVSSFVLKEAFTVLLPELTYLFKLSLTNSIFPQQWKKALVIPIPKAGSLSDVKNYRPISLLPLPGKVLEKLVHCQISDYLNRNMLLSDNQHGFRKSHSTIHSVAQLVNFVNTNMDDRRPVLATFIDFRKAFDCVQHDILLSKLNSLGFSHVVVDWVASYLQDRKQKVFANNIYSEYETIQQGVPQGSVLGPLFYILYANDLSVLFNNCNFALYADDTVLYTAKEDFLESISDMQLDMDRLAGWCRDNGIMVNTDKTKVLVFGSKTRVNRLPPFDVKYEDKPLMKVTSYKYLGLTLDHQLNYNLHIKKLISTVSAKLKQFQRMRSFLTVKAAILVYKNMLLPIIEYGDIFLTAASLKNRKKLQTLQNKGLRCALNKGIETSSSELHREAGLLKLKYRREQHLLHLVYDWSKNKGNLKVKPVNSVVPRSQAKKLFKIKKPYTEKFKKSIAYRGPRKWNLLPLDFHESATKPAFKHLVKCRVAKKSEVQATL